MQLRIVGLAQDYQARCRALLSETTVPENMWRAALGNLLEQLGLLWPNMLKLNAGEKPWLSSLKPKSLSTEDLLPPLANYNLGTINRPEGEAGEDVERGSLTGVGSQISMSGLLTTPLELERCLYHNHSHNYENDRQLLGAHDSKTRCHCCPQPRKPWVAPCPTIGTAAAAKVPLY